MNRLPGTSPTWDDETVGGTRVRVALWLKQVVGEGNVFTKAELREAFPGTEQVDRRMRDLRSSGWVIKTSRQDPTLRPNELRFLSSGDAVWLPEHRIDTGPSEGARREALHRYDYRCAHCGVGAGDPFPDRPTSAAVLITRRLNAEDLLPVGELIVLCQRCSGSSRPLQDGLGLWTLLEGLGVPDRIELSSWLRAGRRPIGEAERAWHTVSRLSTDGRAAILRALDGGGAEHDKKD